MKKVMMLTFVLLILSGCKASEQVAEKQTGYSYSNSTKKKELSFERLEKVFTEYKDVKEVPLSKWEVDAFVKKSGTVIESYSGTNATFFRVKSFDGVFILAIPTDDYTKELQKGTQVYVYGVVSEKQNGYPVLVSSNYFPDYQN